VMPSAEVLAAAAAAAAEWEDGRVEDVSEDEGPRRPHDDDDFMVGPPPPEMIEETDAAPEDAREAEVRSGGRLGVVWPLQSGAHTARMHAGSMQGDAWPMFLLSRLCVSVCKAQLSCGQMLSPTAVLTGGAHHAGD
jgi:hypothetical protein